MELIQRAYETDTTVFPGTHPVSIERKHLPLLKTGYVVCEKTDGTRYLLVCQGVGRCHLVNRKLEFHQVKLAIPKDTVLDGELIGDTFLIFDAVMVGGTSVRHLGYLGRLHAAEGVIRGPSMGLKLRIKNMYSVSESKKLFESNPECDGLIFTPLHDGTTFKWKPLERITIDFKVHGGHLCVWDHDSLVKVQQTSLDKPVIIECCWKGMWVPVKLRTDKDTPNNRWTLMRTMINIRENILVDEF